MSVCCLVIPTYVRLCPSQNDVVLAWPQSPVDGYLLPSTGNSLLPEVIFSSPQGAKIIQSFMWYLNPRQVFDLSQGGPKEA